VVAFCDMSAADKPSHLVSRREVLQLTGTAVAWAVGCEATGASDSAPLPAPAREAAASVHEAAHRRHRMAYLLGDADLNDACVLDCTASLYDHEYGGTKTWH